MYSLRLYRSFCCIFSAARPIPRFFDRQFGISHSSWNITSDILQELRRESFNLCPTFAELPQNILFDLL